MDLTETLSILKNGEITLEGQFMWGSNYTFHVYSEHEDVTLEAVYKPTKGERPLWDFPTDTLAKREVAAYLVSDALGWGLVPPTIYRDTGPYGPGSIQLYIKHDPEYHFFNFSEEDQDRLRPVVLFDIVANNTDRKGGHVILDKDNKIWAIDHGICFHENWKLRTVLWQFAGESLPDDLCQDLHTFRKRLTDDPALIFDLNKQLSTREIKAMISRINRTLSIGTFPEPPTHTRPYPWPLV